MRNYTREQQRRARKVDLYEFLIRNHSDKFYDDGSSLHPIDNKSLSIKRGFSGFLDFGNDEHGNSLDFLVKYLNYDIREAVWALCEDGHVVNNDILIKKIDDLEHKEKKAEFPPPINDSFRNLFAYLSYRGISNTIISWLVSEKLIYQDKKNNIVFCNREMDWGEIRGTNTISDRVCVHRNNCLEYRGKEYNWCIHEEKCENYKKNSFHGIVRGSRSDGYWWFTSDEQKPEKVYVCEAAIDAISLFELHRRQSILEASAYVSIGGSVQKQAAIDRLKEKWNVILAVDNDEAGELCRNNNPELKVLIPKYKDWNEDLKNI